MQHMRRVASLLALIALVSIPAQATYITLTGAGGVSIGAGPLTPPSITPQVSSAFDMNSASGYSNNSLNVPAGASYPPATVANSHYQRFEGTVDNNLLGPYQANEWLFGGSNQQALYLTSNDGGIPTFFAQNTIFGTGFHWFLDTPGIDMASSTLPSSAAGSGYNDGFFIWTATGGGPGGSNCAQEPQGYGTQIAVPGKGCAASTPLVVTALIPGIGATQATGAGGVLTTCVNNSPISGEMTVTAHVAIAHGVVGGQMPSRGAAQTLTEANRRSMYGSPAGRSSMFSHLTRGRTRRAPASKERARSRPSATPTIRASVPARAARSRRSPSPRLTANLGSQPTSATAT